MEIHGRVVADDEVKGKMLSVGMRCSQLMHGGGCGGGNGDEDCNDEGKAMTMMDRE